jgi:hypothetical protein
MFVDRYDDNDIGDDKKDYLNYDAHSVYFYGHVIPSLY